MNTVPKYEINMHNHLFIKKFIFLVSILTTHLLFLLELSLILNTDYLNDVKYLNIKIYSLFLHLSGLSDRNEHLFTSTVAL